jgi:hypothetical protein
MSENSNVRPASCRTSVSPTENSTTTPQNRIDESAICETCGRAGAAEFGDHTLCVDCYQGCGSCCSESETNTEA